MFLCIDIENLSRTFFRNRLHADPEHLLIPLISMAAALLLASVMYILVVFITQAAHEAPAYTGYLRRIQGKALILCHLNGNRCKITEKCCAA